MQLHGFASRQIFVIDANAQARLSLELETVGVLDWKISALCFYVERATSGT
jgi:hypothetical protein